MKFLALFPINVYSYSWFVLVFFLLLFPHPSHQTASSFQCAGGGKPGGISTIRCSPRRGPNPTCFVPPGATSTIRATEACEFDSAVTSNFWCCPQYCDDGVTMIYYEDLMTGGVLDKPKTEECPGPGICPTDSSQICYQPNPSGDARFFCCPDPSAAIPPAGGMIRTTTSRIPSRARGRGRTPKMDDCEDVGGNDCLIREHLCDNPVYFDLMSWQCASTCNRCPSDGSVPTRPPNIANPSLPNQNCKDMLDCSTWKKNGFCMSDFYTADTKAAHCPISCQLGCAIANT